MTERRFRNQGHAVKIGHIYLSTASDDTILEFVALVDALDKLALEQHALVASSALAARLRRCPCVTVGPIVRSPVMAYCLMPEIDVVHIHDDRSGQAGLLLTLTRSIPYVMTMDSAGIETRNPLKRSVYQRAQRLIAPGDAAPDTLIEIYRRAVDAWSKFPENADSR